ncbi:MAG TPA: hypothetical protein DDY13_18205 [Cytophagales bacterium]|jgi:signal transduction histidine kinase|nr:hypothetical protein [Cytophagales bacterium]
MDEATRDRYYEALDRESQKLRKHINQALDWSFTSKKEFPLKFEALDMRALLNEAVDRFLIRTKGKGKVKMAIQKINRQVRGDIFHRFFRAPQPVSNGQNGHGLGLYYTSRVIDAHHGRIDVETQPEKGTSMKIFLPYA